MLIPDSYGLASFLTTFTSPPNIPFDELFLRLRRRGFVIYPGISGIDRETFRVSVMGDLTQSDMMNFVTAYEEVHRELSVAKRIR
jgi:aspartate aminotransferase-like enzyme